MVFQLGERAVSTSFLVSEASFNKVLCYINKHAESKDYQDWQILLGPFSRINRFKSLANFGGVAVHQPNLEGFYRGWFSSTFFPSVMKMSGGD